MLIQQAAHEDANILFGAVMDEKMKDQVKITVIATGFKPETVGANRKASAAAAGAASDGPSRGWNVSSSLSSSSNAPGVLSGSFEKQDLDVPAFLRRRNEGRNR